MILPRGKIKQKHPTRTHTHTSKLPIMIYMSVSVLSQTTHLCVQSEDVASNLGNLSDSASIKKAQVSSASLSSLGVEQGPQTRFVAHELEGVKILMLLMLKLLLIVLLNGKRLHKKMLGLPLTLMVLIRFCRPGLLPRIVRAKKC